jgi:hypothetical protein
MKMTLALLTALLLAPLVALCAAEPITIDLAKRTWQGIPGLEREMGVSVQLLDIVYGYDEKICQKICQAFSVGVPLTSRVFWLAFDQ